MFLDFLMTKHPYDISSTIRFGLEVLWANRDKLPAFAAAAIEERRNNFDTISDARIEELRVRCWALVDNRDWTVPEVAMYRAAICCLFSVAQINEALIVHDEDMLVHFVDFLGHAGDFEADLLAFRHILVTDEAAKQAASNKVQDVLLAVPLRLMQGTIFLDIDGVLNRTGFTPAQSTELPLADWIELQPLAVLVELLAVSGADVVLSSTWRNRSMDEIRASFAAHGVTLPLVGVTPVLGTGPRWSEIQQYVTREGLTHFVILDDEWNMGPLSDHHVRISPLQGLDRAAARLAMEVLQAAAPTVLS